MDPDELPIAAQQGGDPYVWLEEVEGTRALEWAERRNAETRGKLTTHPRYQQVFDQTLDILTASDRIAVPSILGDEIYNLWTDSDHPRGIYRRTSLDSYMSDEPDWETVLDIDALAEAEGVPWVLKGSGSQPVICLEPEERRCLVSLSRGGSDATELREFDLITKSFVEDGFRLPEAKQSFAWVDEDHLLVATTGGGGRQTTSGYPASVRLWERGSPFSRAPVVYSVDEDDNGVSMLTVHTPRGSEPMVLHFETFFSLTYHLYRDGRLAQLDLPDDARAGDDAQALVVDNQLIVWLVSDWTVDGQTFRQGSLVSADLDRFLGGDAQVELLLAPDGRSTINTVTVTKDQVLVSLLTDVQGRLLRFSRTTGQWVSAEIETPPMGAIRVEATSPRDNRFFFTYTSFVEPTTLYLAEEDGTLHQVAKLPAQFEAQDVVVEQLRATSADGTQVPYFIVRQSGLELDGANPTLLTAYGGFQISCPPSYLGEWGKNWVEEGGIFVLANIRGGGEFGPAWWRAALKENRQRAFDDFIAVSEDLIERGLTSPEHLGIKGHSNAGLLVGVAMTQRPDLYGAVIAAVPLLDMKRYHTLLAGASWMAEYGNPDIPDEWRYIRQYSPYLNLDPDGEYPEAFFWTTTRDDRVHPGHARKMTELMRSMGHPVLYFENTEGGHGDGVTPEQRAEIRALETSYLFRKLVDEGGTA